MRLSGKTVVVTGGGSGIGRASALHCGRQGARVVVADIGSESANATTKQISEEGGESLAVQSDVSDTDQVQRLVRQAVERFERLDVLVNCAGIAVRNPVAEQDEASWDKVMQVNLRGVFLCSKYAIPHMRRGGSIIHISSVVGLIGVRNRAAYSATKGAIITLTRNMALDYAGHGIRVNCICPGFTETGMTAALFADPERKRRLTALHPLGRLGTPDDIAHAVVFFASEEASWITGHALAVDGGFSAGHFADV
jgi:NAD(P)-dependent dehydrogenase (short-subunit alcohol dehydrogenase family)